MRNSKAEVSPPSASTVATAASKAILRPRLLGLEDGVTEDAHQIFFDRHRDLCIAFMQ